VSHDRTTVYYERHPEVLPLAGATVHVPVDVVAVLAPAEVGE
jgi:hypothetical protein